jgi:hypothetical protein
MVPFFSSIVTVSLVSFIKNLWCKQEFVRHVQGGVGRYTYRTSFMVESF